MNRSSEQREAQLFYQRLALIQKSMQGYLERYIQNNRLPLREDVVRLTFSTLISGEEPPTAMQDLVQQYIDILVANEVVLKPFKIAMAIKITMMTSSGVGSDAMRILSQLNQRGIHVLQLDTVLPDFPEFISYVERATAAIDSISVPVEKSNDTPAFIDNGRYKILEELGRGAFGVVHRVRDSRLERDVAIKHLLHNFGLPHEKRFLRELHNEAIAFCKFSHPNIVQVYDFLEDATGCYIVMELVSGGSLCGLLAAGRFRDLGQSGILHFFDQVADGLSCAHLKGIVHRDVKPANILLTVDQIPIPKLSDFGISRSIESVTDAVGTPLYMAPEQRHSGAAAAMPQVDVYAFGKVVWECLTGEIGFAISGDHESVSPDLTAVLLKATDIDPAIRYPTIKEMMKAIHGAWKS